METIRDEVQIVKVAAVLAEGNPLGSRADTISDLWVSHRGDRPHHGSRSISVIRRARENSQRYSESSIRSVAEAHRVCGACR